MTGNDVKDRFDPDNMLYDRASRVVEAEREHIKG